MKIFGEQWELSYYRPTLNVTWQTMQMFETQFNRDAAEISIRARKSIRFNSEAIVRSHVVGGSEITRFCKMFDLPQDKVTMTDLSKHVSAALPTTSADITEIPMDSGQVRTDRRAGKAFVVGANDYTLVNERWMVEDAVQDFFNIDVDPEPIWEDRGSAGIELARVGILGSNSSMRAFEKGAGCSALPRIAILGPVSPALDCDLPYIYPL